MVAPGKLGLQLGKAFVWGEIGVERVGHARFEDRPEPREIWVGPHEVFKDMERAEFRTVVECCAALRRNKFL